MHHLVLFILYNILLLNLDLHNIHLYMYYIHLHHHLLLNNIYLYLNILYLYYYIFNLMDNTYYLLYIILYLIYILYNFLIHQMLNNLILILHLNNHHLQLFIIYPYHNIYQLKIFFLLHMLNI